MSPNILVTGAAGYIAGALIAELLVGKLVPISKDNLFATVKTKEQAEAVTKSGVQVLQLNLRDAKAVMESLLRHKISIVIHTASAVDPALAFHLIDGLSEQKRKTGEASYFIHTSGASGFHKATGWPSDETNDKEAVYDTAKRLRDTYPIRQTDVSVIDHAKAKGVISFVVVPPAVYGKGTGEWNKLSVVIPLCIRASIADKRVHEFPENARMSVVHFADLNALYAIIINNILRKNSIPHDQEGYYLALAHRFVWHDFLEHLAIRLHERGLVADSQTYVWPNDDAAARALEVPVPFVQPLWNSGDNMTSEKPRELGWKPEWDMQRFLQNLDHEIDAVLELDKAKSSLIESLAATVK